MFHKENIDILVNMVLGMEEAFGLRTVKVTGLGNWTDPRQHFTNSYQFLIPKVNADTR